MSCPALPRLLTRTMLAGTAVGAAVLGGSVAFVRVSAHGYLYGEVDVPTAPVALVLGAQVRPDGTPSSFLAGRLELARRLYETGKVRAILVSGDNMAPEYNEPDAMRDYLLERGIPADKIICDYAGYDTYDSCVRAQRIFGVTRMIMVTQSYHLPRAVATARRIGLEAYGVGDISVRRRSEAWISCTLRDQVACIKTMIDLATGRDPVLGPRDTGLDRALAP